jgi:serine/threonine protein kinase
LLTFWLFLTYRNAIIHSGVDRGTNHRVIIKAYRKAEITAITQEKMEREVRLLLSLAGQKGIVNILNTVEDEKNHYVVLEACPGKY